MYSPTICLSAVGGTEFAQLLMTDVMNILVSSQQSTGENGERVARKVALLLWTDVATSQLRITELRRLAVGQYAQTLKCARRPSPGVKYFRLHGSFRVSWVVSRCLPSGKGLGVAEQWCHSARRAQEGGAVPAAPDPQGAP